MGCSPPWQPTCCSSCQREAVARKTLGLRFDVDKLVVVLCAAPFIAIGVGAGGGAAGGVMIAIGAVIAVVGLILVTVFSAALSGVFRTALYRYAMLGEEFGGFTHEQISGAFKPKKN